MSKKTKFAAITVLSILVFSLGVFAYFQIKEIKSRTIDSTSAMRSEIDAQQEKIDDLQSYKDEQVRVADERARVAEEERVIAEQRERENTETEKLNSKKDAKQQCENTKKYCTEEIKELNASIDDAQNRVEKDQKNLESDEKAEDVCKKTATTVRDRERCSMISAIQKASFKSDKRVLESQEKQLSDLLKGECSKYKETCY
jgi:hypothetical protein